MDGGMGMKKQIWRNDEYGITVEKFKESAIH